MHSIRGGLQQSKLVFMVYLEDSRCRFMPPCWANSSCCLGDHPNDWFCGLTVRNAPNAHQGSSFWEFVDPLPPQEMRYLDGQDEDESPSLRHIDQGADERTLLLSGLNSKRSRDTLNGPTEGSTWPFVRKIVVETAPTLLFTIIGLTLTGKLLEHVAHWRALNEVDELYILIPMLNNLKGNLEMSLSSRLSTSAVLGELDVASTRRGIVSGTMSLLQVQALIVSAIAAILSFLLGRVMNPTSVRREKTLTGFFRSAPPFRTPSAFPGVGQPRSGWSEFAMVLCTAMASASISGLILSSFMCLLVIICRRYRRNPDNIAPPIASCLGDLLTLCILGLVSSVLVRVMDTALPLVLIFLLSLGTVAAVILTLRNKYVKKLLSSGWVPLCGAMVISSGTGLVLEHFISRYQGFGLLAVAISGLPDAVGCVFVSRLSTSLHVSASTVPPPDGRSTHSPRIFVTITTLFVITLPVQLLYVTFLRFTGWMCLPWLFVILYVVFFCCAVLTALVIANLLTHYLWRQNLDPDTYAMPIQSSMMDLVGQLLLVVCYELAQILGADVKHKNWK